MKLTPAGITDLRDARVELWLPIASDVIVGVGLYDRTELLIPFNTAQVRNQNEASAKQSRQIVGRSSALVKSLAKGVGAKVFFTPVAAPDLEVARVLSEKHREGEGPPFCLSMGDAVGRAASTQPNAILHSRCWCVNPSKLRQWGRQRSQV
ncbi:hypothetical protein ACU8MP_25345 (plasmid) [Rhizobium leguminosarum]